jgi:hypothetical protein
MCNKNLQYYSLIDVHESFPPELISEVYESIDTGKNIFYDPNHTWYKQVLANQSIVEFTHKIFDFPHVSTIQVIKPGLPIHIDFGRTEAYNFIIDTGGDKVETCFYHPDDFYFNENNKLRPNNSKYREIERDCIPSMTWHKLDVSIPHNVIGIETTRISITLVKK